MARRPCRSRRRSASISRARAVSKASGCSQPPAVTGFSTTISGPCGSKPTRNRFGNPARREVLAFNIDVAVSAFDLGNEQALDLVNAGGMGHVWKCARDRDFNIGKIGLEVTWPTRLPGFQRLESLSASALPSLPAQLGQRRGCSARQRCRGVMPRRIGLARWSHPARFMIVMGTSVPPRARDVDAAAKCQAIVDRNNLLVVRSAGGMVTVKFCVNARMAHPFQHRRIPSSRGTVLSTRRYPNAEDTAPAPGFFRHPIQESPIVAGSPNSRSSPLSLMRASKYQPTSMIRFLACTNASRATPK